MTKSSTWIVLLLARNSPLSSSQIGSPQIGSPQIVIEDD